MPLPNPINLDRWWLYPSIVREIAEALNELIGVVRRHLKHGDDSGGDDSAAIAKLTKDLSNLSEKHEKLSAQVEELREINRPRFVITPGQPKDKEILK